MEADLVGSHLYWDLYEFHLGKTPESGIPPSYRATRRYTKVHLGFCLRFSTLIGQIGRAPLFGAGRRRYIRSRLFRLAVTAFWRAFTASWRQKGKRKQIFPRAVRTTEPAFEPFAPDISEQPDPNLTDLFDTRNHGSQRLSAKMPTHTGRTRLSHARTRQSFFDTTHKKWSEWKTNRSALITGRFRRERQSWGGL